MCQGPKEEKPQELAEAGRRPLGQSSVPPTLDAGVMVVLGRFQDVNISRLSVLFPGLKQQVTDLGTDWSVPPKVPFSFGWWPSVAVAVVSATVDRIPDAGVPVTRTSVPWNIDTTLRFRGQVTGPGSGSWSPATEVGDQVDAVASMRWGVPVSFDCPGDVLVGAGHGFRFWR